VGGDLNHDGHLDLVAAFNRWGLYLYYGNGQGGFTGGPVDFLAPRAFDSLGSTLALADLDRDGCLELITLHGGREGHLTTWKPHACRDRGRATTPLEKGEGAHPWQRTEIIQEPPAGASAW
jgi:hypothetical protein